MKNAYTTKNRILSFLLISAMALSVTSCGKKEKDEKTSDTGSFWGDNNDTDDEDSIWGDQSENPAQASDEDSLWGDPSSNPEQSNNDDSLWGDPTENPSQNEEEDEIEDTTEADEDEGNSNNGGGNNGGGVEDKWAPPKLDHYADEKSLYFKDGVFYIDDYLLGLTMDEVDTYFNGGSGFGGYLRYEGNYDFDYYVSVTNNGNEFTFYYLNDILRAICFEFEGSDLGEKRMAAYEAMSGGNYDVHKDPITENAFFEGDDGYGFTYKIKKGYVDLFLRIVDGKTYVATMYSLA